MQKNKLLNQLDFKNQAREWGIPIWQHPQILFGFLGLITITIDLLLYFLGIEYIRLSYDLLVVIIFSVSIFFLLISFFVERTFEKMADASRIKTEFIGIVSHQLRTPVTNLSLVLDLVKHECPDLVKDANGYFDLMRANTQKIKDLISNLLIASRIDKGDYEMPNPEDINLDNEIRESINYLNPLTGKRRVIVNYVKDQNVPIILGNKTQIRMILDNLISNAIIYNKESGKVDILMTIKKGNIEISIQDEGIGIPNMDKLHIAEKFHRGGNANKLNPGGAGLGLYIAKALLRPLKGKLNFKTKEGLGSVFLISIPIKSNAKIGN